MRRKAERVRSDRRRKRLRTQLRSIRHIIFGAGSPVRLQEVEYNNRILLNYGLNFTTTYLNAVQSIILEYFNQEPGTSKAKTSEELQNLNNHLEYIQECFRVLDEIRRGLRIYLDIKIDQREEIFFCSNELFKSIYRSIAPNFYVKIGQPLLTSIRTAFRPPQDTRYEIVPGDEDEDAVVITPGKKTVVPFYPPWKYNDVFKFRKVYINARKKVTTTCEGPLPITVPRGEIEMRTAHKVVKKVKPFAFSYKATGPCEPITPAVLTGIELF